MMEDDTKKVFNEIQKVRIFLVLMFFFLTMGLCGLRCHLDKRLCEIEDAVQHSGQCPAPKSR